ncbi:MAG: RNA-binding domain-containing protein [Candidatus Woesearchaeota archaeon]
MNRDELELILQKGEGQFIEFKESFDKSFTKEVVAFSNASGGKIFIGISDDGKIKGIEHINRLKSQLIDSARGCDPSISIDIDEFEEILVVDVKEGINKPYSCKEGFFLRIGANSQKLKRDEILKLSIKSGNLRFDEQICSTFKWEDFDDDKFKYYLKLAGISNNLKREEILMNLGILTSEGFTNAGVLMFAKEPYRYFKSSKIRCIHFSDTNRVEILDKKEVDKGIIGNIEFGVEYLRDRVPVRFEIKGIKREEYPEYALEAYREAIVNSVIHRDYFNEMADVAVEKLKNRIIINNPGDLMFDEKKFGTLSVPRNRLIADLISKTHFMEKAGTGIYRIKDYSSLNGNKVEFDYDGYFFTTIYSNSQNIVEKSSEKSSEKGSEKSSEKIVLLIKKNNTITIEEMSESLCLSTRAIEKQIKKLQELNIIKRMGGRKEGYWEVIK